MLVKQEITLGGRSLFSVITKNSGVISGYPDNPIPPSSAGCQSCSQPEATDRPATLIELWLSGGGFVIFFFMPNCSSCIYRNRLLLLIYIMAPTLLRRGNSRCITVACCFLTAWDLVLTFVLLFSNEWRINLDHFHCKGRENDS